MHVARASLLIVVGVVAVFIVLDAALRTFVLPRGSVVLFTHVVFRAVRSVLRAVRPAAPHATRRATASWRCTRRSRCSRSRPSSLVVVFAAFACFFAALEDHGWRDAFVDERIVAVHARASSGRPSSPRRSSRSPRRRSGSALLALLIAYLPTIYNVVLAARGRWSPDSRSAPGTPPTRVASARARAPRRLPQRPRPRLGRVDAWFTEVSETHTSVGVARVLPFAEPAPFVDHRGRDGARRGRAAAVGARHPVHARRPGCASARASSRCGRSPTSSASTTTPTRRPTIRSASPARSSIEVYERLAARGPARCTPTGSRRGATSRAGASTTTACCSRCAAS